MKLKTKITASDRNSHRSVSITVESRSNRLALTNREQKSLHEKSVNAAAESLAAEFGLSRIRFTS